MRHMMNAQMFQTTTDLIQEGILCLDDGGTVVHCNQKAKEITGLVLNTPRSHPAGRLEPGDIVLAADNLLGDDDGGMEPGDFGCLGLEDPELSAGDAVLVAGVYGDAGAKPQWIRCGRGAPRQELELAGTIGTVAFSITMARYEKRLTITVDGEAFHLHYLRSMAHTVIVDGKTGQVKFYQAKGYTIRHEELKNLLLGQPFQAKGAGTELGVEGRDFFELFQPSEFTQRVEDVLSGRSSAVLDEELYPNKRMMICSMLPVAEKGEIMGAVVKMTDLSEVQRLLEERDELIKKVEQTNLNLDNQTMDVPPSAFRGFVGSSPPIQQVKCLAFKAAQSRCNVILTGESGTGKSQLAHEIHKLSRPDGPFVEVNCSSIPQNLFESELFGYTGGAFTGALPGGKPGYFEQADGGTLFLDEIAEIPADIQVKLLYAIQNRRFYRVGATKPTDVNVRILSATNRDLRGDVTAGRFREDLYYRINVFPISLPPLRERLSDLYLLSRRLTENLCAQYEIPPKKLSGAAIEKLLSYDWPGNIRELGNVIERAIAICEGGVIYPQDLLMENEGTDTPPESWNLKERLSSVERQTIWSALTVTGGDKARAMELLGLRKSTFYEKLKAYGV